MDARERIQANRIFRSGRETRGDQDEMGARFHNLVDVVNRLVDEACASRQGTV